MNNGVDFAKGRVDKETVDKVTAGYDLPEGVPMFLYVGRIINYKNLPMILDALKILADSGQDFRMVFIGKGPDKEVLESRATELGLMGGENPKVFFTGPIYDRDELRAWNTRGDLFLFPSTFDTNGLVVREAAACGLHVHDVGQHAMDEIYLSWEECVAKAYERYQYILARKKIGVMPARKKQMTDNMVRLVARTMEEGEKVRRNVSGTLGDMRAKALDMVAYTQAEMRSLDSQKLRWNDVVEDLWTEAEVLFRK